MASTPLLRRLRRFDRARGGATTVEFAIVAIPFLLLVFAILELGLVFLVSVTLESAIGSAGRQIRTGQMQAAGATAQSFKTTVCTQMGWIGSNCADALSIDVRTFGDFASSGGALAGARPQTTCWDPGGPGSIVLIRAYYRWPLITPLLETGLQTADGQRLVTATAAFANEPYSDETAASVTCPA